MYLYIHIYIDLYLYIHLDTHLDRYINNAPAVHGNVLRRRVVRLFALVDFGASLNQNLRHLKRTKEKGNDIFHELVGLKQKDRFKGALQLLSNRHM